ncbi:HAMP domain-containing histidine kinase, partial [Paenibacillus sepulcri]|nr:HAMP domain-containing histidine kinase [Paenibacillus sepulcri]
MFQKTRSMLALSYGGIIAIILIIVALAYYLLLSHTLKNNVSTQLKQVFTQVSGQLEGVSLKTGLSIPELLQLTYPKTVAFNWGFLELDEFCIMVDSSGQLLTSSYKQSTNGSIPTEDILAWSKTDISSGGLNALTDHHTPEGRDFTTMLVPLDKSTVDYGYLFTGKEVTSNQYVLNQMRMIMIILGAGLLVIASGIGYVFAGRAMIPIRQAYKRQQEFSADASHELRTPLAVLHSSVEVIGEYRDRLPPFQQDVLQKMEEEISRMTQLVEGLLTLSRSDSEYPQLLLEPFELRAIVAEAVEMMRPLALGAGVRLYFEDKLAAGASSSFHGDKARVKQLVII